MPLADRFLVLVLLLPLVGGIALLYILVAELRRLRRQRERHHESALIRQGETIDGLRRVQRAIRAHGLRLAGAIQVSGDERISARDTPIMPPPREDALSRPPAAAVVEIPVAPAERAPGADEDGIETRMFERPSPTPAPRAAE
ncbi:MAG: hypothetical protein IT372_42155 [Polyangiaceae bacterium]|nr:hypothetical protein [Polyangiaceae bacterium]